MLYNPIISVSQISEIILSTALHYLILFEMQEEEMQTNEEQSILPTFFLVLKTHHITNYLLSYNVELLGIIKWFLNTK